MHDKLGFRETIPLRRKLRRDPTPAEQAFWAQVRKKSFLGLKFVKQNGIGPYIVDFCCRRLMLVVEMDGDSHFTDTGRSSDQARSAYLESLGYRIIRYNNDEVLNNLEGVFQDLENQIKTLKQASIKTSSQSPPSQEEKG